MSGHLAVVGLGPGDARWLTPEAGAWLAAADAIYGYGAYLDRVPVRDGQARHAWESSAPNVVSTATALTAAVGSLQAASSTTAFHSIADER